MRDKSESKLEDVFLQASPSHYDHLPPWDLGYSSSNHLITLLKENKISFTSFIELWKSGLGIYQYMRSFNLIVEPVMDQTPKFVEVANLVKPADADIMHSSGKRKIDSSGQMQSSSEFIYSNSSKREISRYRKLKYFLFVESKDNYGKDCWTVYTPSNNGAALLGKKSSQESHSDDRKYQVKRCRGHEYKIYLTPRTNETLYEALVDLDNLYNKHKNDHDKIENIQFKDHEKWVKEFKIIDADVSSFKDFYKTRYTPKASAVFFKFKAEEDPTKISACLQDIEEHFKNLTSEKKRSKSTSKKKGRKKIKKDEKLTSSQNEKAHISTPSLHNGLSLLFKAATETESTTVDRTSESTNTIS